MSCFSDREPQGSSSDGIREPVYFTDESGEPLSEEELKGLSSAIDSEIDNLQSGNVPTRLIVSETSTFSGPLPSPDTLLGYEKACPGAADRVIAMAEKQAAHRQELESAMIRASISADEDDRGKEFKLSVIGSIFAFLLCLSLIVIGGICLYFEKNLAGIVSIGMAIAAMGGVSLFNWRRAKSRQEEDRKNGAEPESE